MSTEKNVFINSVINTQKVTILSGFSESSVLDLAGSTMKTIILPDSFTGGTIAFKISDDGITYHDYYNADDALVFITCTAGRAYGVTANDFYSIRYVKLVSDATESADREIKILCRGV